MIVSQLIPKQGTCKLTVESPDDLWTLRRLLAVGDTVVCCFRPQAFVTRGRTQAISGLRGGELFLGGRYDEEARLVEGRS